MEDLSPREGGSTESIEIRDKALAILAEKKKKQEEENTAANETNGAANGSGEKKKKGPKLSGREKKEKEWDELRPICIELVNEIDDLVLDFANQRGRIFWLLRWLSGLTIWHALRSGGPSMQYEGCESWT